LLFGSNVIIKLKLLVIFKKQLEKPSILPTADTRAGSRPEGIHVPDLLGLGRFGLGVGDGLGHLAAGCFAFLAR
jgi:hypothetical protein